MPLSNDRSGPYYDPDLEFSIEAAEPKGEARELANVFDEWLRLMQKLERARI